MVYKPQGIAERFEQLRPAILRSKGSTPSERYLARLAERAFLDLWSFPNPYRDQKLAGGADGKELCDLLVVCDPHIIIFSEKNIRWPDKPDEIAWPRWFRKAVLDAAKQIAGAERWILNEPGKIFLDSKCLVPVPLDFPKPEDARVHRVVVVRGAAEACRKYFKGGTGSFVIRPDLVGGDHLNEPFHIGDLDPGKGFVHVFDEIGLDAILQELDTISDFTAYLEKREKFIRSGKLILAHGEEDLFAYYAIRLSADGDHDFTPPGGKSWADAEPIGLDGSHWSGLKSDPRYKAKKEADRVSYAWDGLIGVFTKHLLGGTSIVLEGFEYSLKNSERALRYMALQNRLQRRGLGQAFLSALNIGRKKDIFFRAMISSGDETGFFILTIKYTKFMDQNGGYEKYRLIRTEYLRVYAISLLRQNPHLRRVVGVAMEPPGQNGGSSEDNIFVEQQDWDEETIKEVDEIAAKFGIMRSLKPHPYHNDEYPSPTPEPKKPYSHRDFIGNRRERRAAAAKRNKRG